MDTEVKRKWIEALRSGDYKQGKGLLQNDRGEFCCLGVLCEIVDANKEYTSDGFAYYWGTDDSTCLLPIGLRSALRISAVAEAQLTSNNDTGWTFDEIADWIEENL